MPANPLHYLLVQRPRPYIEKENYFLLVIQSSKGVSFIFNGDVYYIASQHLTIYKEAIDKKNHNKVKVRTPIHSTITARTGGKEIVAHIYYGDEAEYLFTEIRQTKPDKKKISLHNKKDDFWKNSQTYARPVLDDLFEELIGEQKKIVDVKDKRLQALVTASMRSTTDENYKNLLRSAIKTLAEYEQWDFDPDCSIKKRLEDYANYLNTHEKKLAAVASRKMKKTDEVKQEPILAPASVPEKSKEEIPDVSTKTSDDLSGEFQRRLDVLSQQFKDCPEEDIDQLLSIIQKIDKTKKLAETALLIRLCIEGNVVLFKRHFAANLNAVAAPLLAGLLPTCVYHGHVELFDYIFHQIRSERNKYRLCGTPYVELYPAIIYASGDVGSLLAIAYERRNLDFFKKLLTTYHYRPKFSSRNPLTETILDGETDYAIALLEAGIDPNVAASHATVNMLFIQNVEGFNEKKREQSLKYSVTQKKLQEDCEIKNTRLNGSRPLHLAVQKNNLAVVESLLEHGADSHALTDTGETPFGCAVYNGADREIIARFIREGHDIDERQTTSFASGLFAACSKQNLELVKLLLGFKANPCALHDKVRSIHQTIYPYHSPLLMTLIKGNIPILNELLKCSMQQIDLQKTYWVCKNEKIVMPPMFIEKYVKVCQDDAEQAKSTHDFRLAAKLYQEILFATDDREIKHMALYELALCHDANGQKDAAIIQLNICIQIRESLANDPIKAVRMRTLIEIAKERLDEIEKSIIAQSKVEEHALCFKTI